MVNNAGLRKKQKSGFLLTIQLQITPVVAAAAAAAAPDATVAGRIFDGSRSCRNVFDGRSHQERNRERSNSGRAPHVYLKFWLLLLFLLLFAFVIFFYEDEVHGWHPNEAWLCWINFLAHAQRWAYRDMCSAWDTQDLQSRHVKPWERFGFLKLIDGRDKIGGTWTARS